MKNILLGILFLIGFFILYIITVVVIQVGEAKTQAMLLQKEYRHVDARREKTD